jgi:hypothetical protein
MNMKEYGVQNTVKWNERDVRNTEHMLIERQ